MDTSTWAMIMGPEEFSTSLCGTLGTHSLFDEDQGRILLRTGRPGRPGRPGTKHLGITHDYTDDTAEFNEDTHTNSIVLYII